MSDTTKPGAPDPDSETGIDVEEPTTDTTPAFDPATIPPRRTATLGDSIGELAHTVVTLRRELKLTEGGAIKIIDLALTYHIANKQLSQANPFAGFTPEPPTETPTDG